MAEHYTKATESTLIWCNRCRKLTVHPVSGNRAGRCSECPQPELTKAQQKRREKAEHDAKNPGLF